MDINLILINKNFEIMPIVVGDITVSTVIKGCPGTIKFQILKDKNLNIELGNVAYLTVNGQNIFYGFIFKIDMSEDDIINITAYDQLRYLKNKDSYVFTNKTASEVVKFIASAFNLKTGTIEDTEFKIASRVEDNSSLFDIIQTYLDLTLQNKKEMFVLSDNFGKITLSNISSNIVPIIIDSETGKSFNYSSSIDSETYNQVKLIFDNSQTGKRETYVAKDSNNINKWGLLQFFDTLNEGENGKAKADSLLSLYNKTRNNLSINDVIGDPRVKAGSMVFVNISLGDIKVSNLMLVEKCKHTFSDNEHKMDLTISGGDFVA